MRQIPDMRYSNRPPKPLIRILEGEQKRHLIERLKARFAEFRAKGEGMGG